MLKFDKTKSKKIIVLGAGGTGGWLLTMLDKLSLPDDSVLIVDGDIVEEKNIIRQAFYPDDVNKYKAEIFADKFGFNYTTDYLDSVEMLKELIDSCEGEIPIVVGCLDNNASRKIVHDLFESEIEDLIWVDSGNAERHGQVYVAVKENGNVIVESPINLDEAFQNYEGDERRPDQISCAEHSESAPQNIAANLTAALITFNILNNILSSGALMSNKYDFDTRTIGFNQENI